MSGARWLIDEPENGPILVTRNRRFHSRHDDLDKAKQAAFADAGPTDRVAHQSPDGYRQIVRSKRRGWRQPRVTPVD